MDTLQLFLKLLLTFFFIYIIATVLKSRRLAKQEKARQKLKAHNMALHDASNRLATREESINLAYIYQLPSIPEQIEVYEVEDELKESGQIIQSRNGRYKKQYLLADKEIVLLISIADFMIASGKNKYWIAHIEDKLYLLKWHEFFDLNELGAQLRKEDNVTLDDWAKRFESAQENEDEIGDIDDSDESEDWFDLDDENDAEDESRDFAYEEYIKLHSRIPHIETRKSTPKERLFVSHPLEGGMILLFSIIIFIAAFFIIPSILDDKVLASVTIATLLLLLSIALVIRFMRPLQAKDVLRYKVKINAIEPSKYGPDLFSLVLPGSAPYHELIVHALPKSLVSYVLPEQINDYEWCNGYIVSMNGYRIESMNTPESFREDPRWFNLAIVLGLGLLLSVIYTEVRHVPATIFHYLNDSPYTELTEDTPHSQVKVGQYVKFNQPHILMMPEITSDEGHFTFSLFDSTPNIDYVVESEMLEEMDVFYSPIDERNYRIIQRQYQDKYGEDPAAQYRMPEKDELMLINLSQLRHIAESIQAECENTTCNMLYDEFYQLVTHFGTEIYNDEFSGCTEPALCVEQYLNSQLGKNGESVKNIMQGRWKLVAISIMQKEHDKKMVKAILSDWNEAHKAFLIDKMKAHPNSVPYIQIPTYFFSDKDQQLLKQYQLLTEIEKDFHERLYEGENLGQSLDRLEKERGLNREVLQATAEQLSALTTQAAFLSWPLLVVDKTDDTLVLDAVPLKVLQYNLVEMIALLFVFLLILWAIRCFHSSKVK